MRWIAAIASSWVALSGFSKQIIHVIQLTCSVMAQSCCQSFCQVTWLRTFMTSLSLKTSISLCSSPSSFTVTAHLLMLSAHPHCSNCGATKL
jgi:hypothetical protein